MSPPHRLDKNEAEVRRIARLLAGALGITSALICGTVIFVGYSLADVPASPAARHGRTPVPAELPAVKAQVAVALPARHALRQFVDIAPRDPVEHAAPWLQTAPDRPAGRDD